MEKRFYINKETTMRVKCGTAIKMKKLALQLSLDAGRQVPLNELIDILLESYLDKMNAAI